MDETKEPYRVEVEREGCERCGIGRQWAIVGPTDEEQATDCTYGDPEEAEHITAALNNAFEIGRERAEKAEALARRAIHAVEELSWLLDSDQIQAACSLAALHGYRYSYEHVNRAASAEQAAQDVLANPLVKRLREER